MTAWLRQLTMQTRNDLSQREASWQTTQVYVCTGVCVYLCVETPMSHRHPSERGAWAAQLAYITQAKHVHKTCK